MKCLWLLFFTSFCFADDEVIKLNPPHLSDSSPLEKIVCERPMRDEKLNISVEDRDEKTIVNNYGHGGSGYTTLFGSVNKACRLYASTNPDKETPIMVVGSGCIGLTTAIELKRLGYNVKGIQTKERFNIASYKAGGILALASVALDPSIAEIGIETFLVMQEIINGKHPYIKATAFPKIDSYCNGAESGLEHLINAGLMPDGVPVTLDFGGVQRTGFKKYESYFINVSGIMQDLIQEVERLEIPIIIQEACCYCCVDAPVVFNCSALGSLILNEDEKVKPVRGHLITLNEEAGDKHLDYLIYGEYNGKYFYLIPKTVSVSAEFPEGRKCSGVLGGTFIPNAAHLSPEEQEALDKASFEEILRTNRAFFYGE